MSDNLFPLPPNFMSGGVSNDCEMAGPCVYKYSLLSIGACLMRDEHTTFYVELCPDRDAFNPEALALTGLSMERLRDEGLPPKVALEQFRDWTMTHASDDPLFVGYNAGFDWMFLQYYAGKYDVELPFGWFPFCTKSRFGAMDKRKYPLPHHGLKDAILQRQFAMDMARKADLI